MSRFQPRGRTACARAAIAGLVLFAVSAPVAAAGEAALPNELECLKSEVPAVRSACIRSLGSYRDHDAILEPLTAALSDTDAGVRNAAVDMAAGLPHLTPELVAALKDRLQDDNGRVVLAALRLLEGTDSERAVRALLRHESKHVRIIAARTLSNMARIAAAARAGQAPPRCRVFKAASVTFLDLDRSDGVGVSFYAYPAEFWLERDQPQFELFLRRLEAGLADQRRVLFTNQGFDLSRVLVAPRPGLKKAKPPGINHCLLVADELSVSALGCNVVESRMLALAAERYLSGDSFPEADLAGALSDGELFFWGLEERRSFNAAFVRFLADAGGEPSRTLLVALAHPSLEEALNHALETAASDDRAQRSRLSAVLQVVSDEVRAHTDE